MSRDEIRKLTRKWANRVLNHERDDRRRIVPTGKAPGPKLSWKEHIRRMLRDRGWPEHRIAAKLGERGPDA